MSQMSLLDVTPQGRTRATDPEPSRVAASRCRSGTQRAAIRDHLTVHAVVTADDLYEAHPGTPRGTWSTRLGSMVHDGLLEKAGEAPGASQMVTAYRFTPAGWEWAR